MSQFDTEMYLLGTSEFIISATVLNRDLHEENCSRAIRRSLAELKQRIKDVQVFGSHSGKIYSRPSGSRDLPEGSALIKEEGSRPRRRPVAVGGRRFHQASKEGEAPAPDTFGLVNSVTSEQFSAVSGEVRVEKEYGAILERRRNRPFFRKTSEEFQERFAQIVAEETKVVKTF